MAAHVYAPRLRPERLIAAGRVLLAVSSLFAVWLDPGEPVRLPELAYGVLVGYVVYAWLIAAAVWRRETVSTRLTIATHATDLVCFSLFIFFTEGPASPFTVYFVFALLSATLRWQSRGTLWTAVVVLTAFAGFGVYDAVIAPASDFDLRAFIIRGVYLAVLAGLLGQVGAEDHRTRAEMWQLASWPQAVPSDADALTRELVSYAGPLLGAPRLVLAWAEPDARWRRVAAWDRGRWMTDRLPADAALVAAALRDRAFICSADPMRRTLVQEPDAPALVVWQGEPFDPGFARLVSPAPGLSLPLPGERVDGRLFVFDKPGSTLDDLVLAEIVAGMMAARLDAYFLAQQLRQAAATEERIRLARDLHDGVLQSFTGVALRLAVIRRLLETDREAAAPALEEVQRILASEQRDIRFFIDELKPSTHPGDETALDARLVELGRRMEREWDLHVDLTVEALGKSPTGDRATSAALDRDIYHIVREALMNAARHGAASAARVGVTLASNDRVRVVVMDNGRGFAFSGRYSADDLARLDLGPKTLRDRVRALQGSLVLESGVGGAELDIVLPLASGA